MMHRNYPDSPPRDIPPRHIPPRHIPKGEAGNLEPALGPALERWLAAESASLDMAEAGRAEEALFGLFESLPTPAPSPGFSDRVLVAAGIRPDRVGVVVPAAAPGLRDRTRLVTALACALGAAAALVMVPLAVFLLLHVDPASTLAWATQGFSALVRGAIDLLRVGQALTGLGRAAWLVATSPPVLAILCALGLSILLLSRGLLRLIHPERIRSHAPAH